MQIEIIRMIEEFEQGRLTRRQLITHLSAMVAASFGLAVTARAQPAESGATFHATDLHHIALSVRDVPRSAKWYQQHLGLKPMGSEGFLTTGRGWLALFEGGNPGLHHYCYRIPGYTPDAAVAKLKAAGLTPKRRGDRVYFDDPDGIEVQVAGG